MHHQHVSIVVIVIALLVGVPLRADPEARVRELVQINYDIGVVVALLQATSNLKFYDPVQFNVLKDKIVDTKDWVALMNYYGYFEQVDDLLKAIVSSAVHTAALTATRLKSAVETMRVDFKRLGGSHNGAEWYAERDAVACKVKALVAKLTTLQSDLAQEGKKKNAECLDELSVALKDPRLQNEEERAKLARLKDEYSVQEKALQLLTEQVEQKQVALRLATAELEGCESRARDAQFRNQRLDEEYARRQVAMTMQLDDLVRKRLEQLKSEGLQGDDLIVYDQLFPEGNRAEFRKAIKDIVDAVIQTLFVGVRPMGSYVRVIVQVVKFAPEEKRIGKKKAAQMTVSVTISAPGHTEPYVDSFSGTFEEITDKIRVFLLQHYKGSVRGAEAHYEQQRNAINDAADQMRRMGFPALPVPALYPPLASAPLLGTYK